MCNIEWKGEAKKFSRIKWIESEKELQLEFIVKIKYISWLKLFKTCWRSGGIIVMAITITNKMQIRKCDITNTKHFSINFLLFSLANTFSVFLLMWLFPRRRSFCHHIALWVATFLSLTWFLHNQNYCCFHRNKSIWVVIVFATQMMNSYASKTAEKTFIVNCCHSFSYAMQKWIKTRSFDAFFVCRQITQKNVNIHNSDPVQHINFGGQWKEKQI